MLLQYNLQVWFVALSAVQQGITLSFICKLEINDAGQPQPPPYRTATQKLCLGPTGTA